ncbi:polysaccharide deacetylase family protein [Neobacillus mesonae]|uniref:hypothetical protein n=1 Tax=Neobacillus mesonae TaxID=1193713 RepID=UPI00083670B5|nr:hypothetical protein [Neobacillus mesonae]
MKVKICKWFNNSASPVLLMIDDLANVWVDVNGDSTISVEEDWGYAKNASNSAFRYLNERILLDYPEVKTTFYVPVGPRVGMVKNPKIKSISKRIDYDKDTIDFFRGIHQNPKFEIAYHGTSHGRVGVTSKDFIQEWETYKSLDEAKNTINAGKEVFFKVFGEYPKGGKYCGYKSGKFGDQSIDETGFLWWNRYFNKGINMKGNSDVGSDYNKITNFDIKKFGKNGVIDIPSTLLGGMFNDVLFNRKDVRGVIKFLLKPYLLIKKYQELESLLKNKLVISVQEHMSPSRDDGKRQTPNIIDDEKSLKLIFDFLKNKNVWYCTGTELAEYVYLRDNSQIIQLNGNQFKIVTCIEKPIKNKKLSLILDSNVTKVKQPDNKIIAGKNGVFNLDASSGIYDILID